MFVPSPRTKSKRKNKVRNEPHCPTTGISEQCPPCGTAFTGQCLPFYLTFCLGVYDARAAFRNTGPSQVCPTPTAPLFIWRRQTGPLTQDKACPVIPEAPPGSCLPTSRRAGPIPSAVSVRQPSPWLRAKHLLDLEENLPLPKLCCLCFAFYRPLHASALGERQKLTRKMLRSLNPSTSGFQLSCVYFFFPRLTDCLFEF